MKYILGLLFLFANNAYAAPDKKISKRGPQQVIGEFGKVKNLKPLMIQWNTDACEDPIDEGYALIIDSGTIASFKAALKKKTKLDEALAKRIGMLYKPAETAAYTIQTTELDVDAETAQYHFAKDKNGYPELEWDTAGLLSMFKGNRKFKDLYVSLHNPDCE